jgi:hypothetical protein
MGLQSVRTAAPGARVPHYCHSLLVSTPHPWPEHWLKPLQLQDTWGSWQKSYTGDTLTSNYRGPALSSKHSKVTSSHSRAIWGSVSHVSSVPKPISMSPPSRTSASWAPTGTMQPSELSRRVQGRDTSSSRRVVSWPCPWITPWCMWCNRIPPLLRWDM